MRWRYGSQLGCTREYGWLREWRSERAREYAKSRESDTINRYSSQDYIVHLDELLRHGPLKEGSERLVKHLAKHSKYFSKIETFYVETLKSLLTTVSVFFLILDILPERLEMVLNTVGAQNWSRFTWKIRVLWFPRLSSLYCYSMAYSYLNQVLKHKITGHYRQIFLWISLAQSVGNGETGVYHF